MNKLFLFFCIFFNVYYLFMNLIILTQQYYSLYRLYKLKYNVILSKTKYYFSCLVFLISSVVLYFLNNQIIAGYLMLLTLFISVIETKIKGFKFTRRNLILFISSIIITNLIFYFIYLFNPFLGISLVIIISNLSLIITYYLLLPLEKIIQNYYIKKAHDKIIKNNYIVIGITGSFGKTTTRTFIYSLLKEDYLISNQDHNYNTLMGLCKYINNEVKDEDDILLVELGVDHINSMLKFKKIFNLDYAIITSIGEMHLSTFKNIENIAKEKLSISKLLKKGGKIYLHSQIEKEFKKYIDFKYIVYDEKELEFKKDFFYQIYYLDQFVETKLLIEKQLSSLDISLIIAKEFKINDDKIKYILQHLIVPNRRLNTYYYKNYFVIDNSYNGNIEGIKEIIESIKLDKRKKIVITGGLIELDKKYVQYNELIGEKLNDLDYIYLINKNYNHPLIKKIDKNKLMVFKSLIQAYSELDKNKEESILLLLCKGNDLYLK